MRLRSYNGEIVQFAESVWGRDPSEAAGEFKADSRWTKGIWLGKVKTSDEHIVGRGTTIAKVRVVRRCPEEERWDVPLLRDLVRLLGRRPPSRCKEPLWRRDVATSPVQ